MKKLLLITFVTINCFAMEPVDVYPDLPAGQTMAGKSARALESFLKKAKEKIISPFTRGVQLRNAARDGDGAKVHDLLMKGVNPNWKNVCALWVAASRGHAQICHMLIQAGARIDVPADDGRTPLLIAAQNNKFEVCKILVEHGASVNVVSDYGLTPLIAASFSPTICKLLLNAGADPLGGRNGWNYFYRTAYFNPEIMQLSKDIFTKLVIDLVEKKANLNEPIIGGRTLLQHACYLGMVDICSLLLESGADILAPSKEGFDISYDLSDGYRTSLSVSKHDKVNYFYDLDALSALIIQACIKKIGKTTPEELATLFQHYDIFGELPKLLCNGTNEITPPGLA